MILVSSIQLERAADEIAAHNRRPRLIPSEGVTVSASQMRTAAKIIREAEPSVANGKVSERPGFIEDTDQDDPLVLVLRVGILSTELHRIDRRGNVPEEER